MRRAGAALLLVATLTACGSTAHRPTTGGVSPAVIAKIKRLTAEKKAAIAKTKAAVRAVGPTNVYGPPCSGAPRAVSSPDGRRLAWAGGGAICIGNADGGGGHALPQTRGRFSSGASVFWVQPGRLLVGDDYTVSRVPLAGKPTLIASAGAPEYAVAAQGSRFTASTESDCPDCVGQATIWNLDGTRVGAVGDPNAYNDPPSLSPDGSQVAYVEHGAIWTANADGSGARELVPSGGAPLWSPAGNAIAYVTSQGLWVGPAAGGTPRLLARGVGDDGGWSPNGKLIAASWRRGKPVVVDVATRKETALPFVGYTFPGEDPWSADSKSLLVSSSITQRCSALWREPVDGSRPVLLSSCL